MQYFKWIYEIYIDPFKILHGRKLYRMFKMETGKDDFLEFKNGKTVEV